MERIGGIDPRSAREWHDVDRAVFHAEIAPRYEPAILRGVVAKWPAVQASHDGPEGVGDYLARLDSGAPVEAFVGPPEIKGRFFYNPDVSAFNFSKVRTRLSDLMGKIIADAGQEARLAIYMGSTPAAQVAPAFERDNSLPLLPGVEPRLWVGNESRVAAHFDEADNIACVVAGRRRFTLFPPGQARNLYIGPLDFTMAGQPASMVDLHDPDFDLYPRFREALGHALVAELEPGDAVYIPALWWHHVEALSPLNILVNYWWQNTPPDAGSAFPCLAHGVLTMSNLPEERRAAWRELFDHFVFQRNGDPAAHLPVGRRGILDESTPQLRSRLRQFLLRVLSHP